MKITIAGNISCAKDEVKINEKNNPLVTDIYTADPSAHVFAGKLYIYPSHDIDTGSPDDGRAYMYFGGLSGGVMHLRTIKMTEFKYNEDGTIITFYSDKL